ncbi:MULTISPECIES: hypothetical protein [Streptomyces]|uniref:hypothetical protein n=1 Tax=Streptomyces lycopersici TaxID=2974589 RepID=UPI0021D0944B|nr:hypothetical protein [Streptomyces sp. NEAU-383]
MSTDTATAVTSIVNALRQEGYGWVMSQRAWLHGERIDPDRVRVAAIGKASAQGLRPTGRLIGAVMDLCVNVPESRPAPDPEPEPADLALPVPSTEELAQDAAYMVDLFFMFSLAFTPEPWAFTNDDVNCDALPADIRRTCYRAGLTVAAGHGVPDRAPTMRQVANALIRRMVREGRIKR